MFENRIKKFRFIGFCKFSVVPTRCVSESCALWVFYPQSNFRRVSPVVSPRTEVDTSMHWSRSHYIREADLRKNAKAKLLKNVLFNSGPITRDQVINSFSCLIVYKLQLKYISTTYQSSLLCWQTTFAPMQLVHSMGFVSQA